VIELESRVLPLLAIVDSYKSLSPFRKKLTFPVFVVTFYEESQLIILTVDYSIEPVSINRCHLLGRIDVARIRCNILRRITRIPCIRWHHLRRITHIPCIRCHHLR
jgi:hypothetical protein